MKNNKIKILFTFIVLFLSKQVSSQLDLDQFNRDSTDIKLEKMWLGTWVRDRAEYIFGDTDTNYRSYQFFENNTFKFTYLETGRYFMANGQYFVKDSLLYIVTVWKDTSFISDIVLIEVLDSTQTVDTRVVGNFSNRKTTYAKKIRKTDSIPNRLPNKDLLREQNGGFAERRPAVFS